jgi:hypothetical protein
MAVRRLQLEALLPHLHAGPMQAHSPETDNMDWLPEKDRPVLAAATGRVASASRGLKLLREKSVAAGRRQCRQKNEGAVVV